MPFIQGNGEKSSPSPVSGDDFLVILVILIAFLDHESVYYYFTPDSFINKITKMIKMTKIFYSRLLVPCRYLLSWFVFIGVALFGARFRKEPHPLSSVAVLMDLFSLHAKLLKGPTKRAYCMPLLFSQRKHVACG